MNPSVMEGDSPLLLAQPHGGVWVPDEILARFNEKGRTLADTDWHISRLYADLVSDITVVSTPVHRYVIDVNRGSDDASLYPGQNTTGLCPDTNFDGEPIYLTGQSPSVEEIAERQAVYHQPYHDALALQLERLKAKHGYAILYDCHSIRSQVPYLFSGRLPDFNIGSNDGKSCRSDIQNAVEAACARHPNYRQVSNGRFKGGWTTRYYGQPDNNQHAIQMELAQICYMREQAPWDYLPNKAQSLRGVLREVLQALLRL
ncbi:MAG: N-formylglutamate deformylase [Luminiphilus sp.]